MRIYNYYNTFGVKSRNIGKAGYCISYDQASVILGTLPRENFHSWKKERHLNLFREASTICH